MQTLEADVQCRSPNLELRVFPLPAAFFTPWGEGQGEGQVPAPTATDSLLYRQQMPHYP